MDDILESSSEPSSFNIADELQKKSLLKTSLADEISELASTNVLGQLSLLIQEIEGQTVLGDNLSIGFKPSDEKVVFPPTTSFLSKGIRDEISMYVTSFAVEFIVEVSIDDKAYSNKLMCSDIVELDKLDIVLDLLHDEGNSDKISIQIQVTKTVISTVLQKKNAELKSLEIEVDNLSSKMRDVGKKVSGKAAVNSKKARTGKSSKTAKKTGPVSSQRVLDEEITPASNWWQSATNVVMGVAMNSFVAAFEFRGYGCFFVASYLIYKYGEQVSV